jgi:hypothetical protein
MQTLQQEQLVRFVTQYSASERAARRLLQNAQALAALAEIIVQVNAAQNYAQLCSAYNAGVQLLAHSLQDCVILADAQRMLANYCTVVQ